MIFIDLLIGLGIFLYGMHLLEAAARDLSASRIKTWLLTSTRTPLGSAFTGILLTALLQSSSLVGLIVLAFASANIIPFKNAVGIFLGANLGTTFTGWLVTFIGFKLDLTSFALPMLAIGGISQVLISKPSKQKALGALLLGLALLLFGLDHMKASVSGVPDALSMDSLTGYSPFIYLMIGAAMTALIQSSSAMMMITLSALNAQLISLPDAAALVIGADLGTTSTVLLGSMTGNIVKRQLAFAHLFFNVVVDIAAFFILLPFIENLMDLMGVNDPLYGLVAFHSIFNLIGLMVFIPILKPFTAWINRLFRSGEQPSLTSIPTNVPDVAISALTTTITRMWFQAISLNIDRFSISRDALANDAQEKFNAHDATSDTNTESFLQRYHALKSEEQEVIQFVLDLQQESLTPPQTEAITHAIEAVRAIVYGSKTLKDISDNIANMSNASAGRVERYFQQQQAYQAAFNSQLIRLVESTAGDNFTEEEISELWQKNDLHQSEMDKLIYQNTSDRNGDSLITSSQLNVNHEIHHATKSFLNGLQHWHKIPV
ncbi:Na/Pi cotransporter family protein [Aurantivibrio plasticivorans]